MIHAGTPFVIAVESSRWTPFDATRRSWVLRHPQTPIAPQTLQRSQPSTRISAAAPHSSQRRPRAVPDGAIESRQILRRILHEPHRCERITVGIQNAEHRKSMQHQRRHVCNRARIDLSPSTVGDRRKKIALGFGIRQQFAQFLGDPRRVDHAHVERQRFAQSIECFRIDARQPDRVRASLGRSAVLQLQLLQTEDELVAGRSD